MMLSLLTIVRKVFGVAPPQTLYHTRKPDSPRPLSLGPASTSTLNIDAPPSIIPLDPLSFFIAQGFGQKGKKPRRSATPDSSRALISRTDTNNSIDIYTNYQASLNSLIEIVDNVRLLPLQIPTMKLTGFSSCRTIRSRSKPSTTSSTPMTMVPGSDGWLMTTNMIPVNLKLHPQRSHTRSEGALSRFAHLSTR